MKYILSLFFFVTSLIYADDIVGPPAYIDISTYAIEDYSKVDSPVKVNSIKRPIAHKNRFVEQMTNNIKAKYPNTAVRHVRDRENAAATANSFLTDNTDDSEIVFFSGHGSQQTSRDNAGIHRNYRERKR